MWICSLCVRRFSTTNICPVSRQARAKPDEELLCVLLHAGVLPGNDLSLLFDDRWLSLGWLTTHQTHPRTLLAELSKDLGVYVKCFAVASVWTKFMLRAAAAGHSLVYNDHTRRVLFA